VRAINYVAPLVAQFLTWKFLRRFSPADFSVFPLQVPWVFSLVTFIVRLLLDMLPLSTVPQRQSVTKPEECCERIIIPGSADKLSYLFLSLASFRVLRVKVRVARYSCIIRVRLEKKQGVGVRYLGHLIFEHITALQCVGFVRG